MCMFLSIYLERKKERKEERMSHYKFFCSCVHIWFLCLVSLFNGISTLFRLFNAKAILLEEQ